MKKFATRSNVFTAPECPDKGVLGPPSYNGRVVKGMLKAIDAVNSGIRFLLIFLMTVLTIVVFTQVIYRFVLESPLTWSEEVARYSLVWMTFLGAALGVRYNALIGVEFVVNLLPKSLRDGLRYVVYVLCMVFFIAIVIQGIKMVEAVHLQESPALGLPMSVAYAAVPVGGLLMLMNSLAGVIELAKGGKKS